MEEGGQEAGWKLIIAVVDVALSVALDSARATPHLPPGERMWLFEGFHTDLPSPF